MDDNNLIPFNVNENNIWLGNKFFDPTSNLVLEIKDFINKRLELDKEIKKAYAVDGKIIGPGEADFTKEYITYELNYKNKDFYLVDMPGIGGDESKYKNIIKNALEKSHSIIYVYSPDKKPEISELEKIKKYLKDNYSIYYVGNARGKADSYEFDEDRISLDITHKDANEVAKETYNILSEVFNDGISEKSMVVQGLIAFSSVAHINNISTVYASEKYDLKKSQEKYLKYFKSYDNMRKFSRIDDIVSIIENKVNTFEDDIKKSNIKRILGKINDLFLLLIKSRDKYNDIVKRTEENIRYYKIYSEDYLFDFKKNYKNKILNLFDKVYNNILDNIFEKIDKYGIKFIKKKYKTSIENEIQEFIDKEKNNLEITIKKEIEELLYDLSENLENSINRLKADLESILEISEIEYFNLNNKYLDIDFSKLFNKIKFNFKDIIINFLVPSSISILLFFIFPPAGIAFIIIGAISIIIDAGISLIDIIDNNRVKELLKRRAIKEIEKLKKELYLSVKKNTEEVFNYFKEAIDDINMEIDNIHIKQNNVINLLNKKIDKLYTLMEELKEI